MISSCACSLSTYPSVASERKRLDDFSESIEPPFESNFSSVVRMGPENLLLTMASKSTKDLAFDLLDY